MSNEQERTLRSWLIARDPGDAPGRLRTAVAEVPSTTSRTFGSELGVAFARVFGLSRTAWIAVILVVLLVAALAVAGAAVWRAIQPFPPHGLIAYTIPLSATGSTGIHLVSVDGSNQRFVSPGTANTYDHSPRSSPDGRTLAFARTTELDAFSACGGVGSIVLYDAATGTERVLATGLRPIGEAEWTPGGDRIAFLWPPAGCGAPGELGFVDVATGTVTTSALDDGIWQLQRTLTAITVVKTPSPEPGPPGVPFVIRRDVPSWNGDYVATLSVPGEGGVGALDVVDRATGTKVPFGAGGSPSWSPDGRSLAFVRVVARTPSEAGLDADYRDHLVVASADGWGVRILADVLAPGGLPYDDILRLSPLFWTRDGSAIYWMDTKGGHVVEVASGNVFDLPAVVTGCEDLQWQPLPG